MIYVKPRKMMSVERMRRQQQKHHPTRYMVWYFDRDDIVDMDPDCMVWIMNELKEQFMVDVRRWNFSRKATLSEVMAEQMYDIDFNRIKVVFSVRRLPKWSVVPPPRTLTQIVDEFCSNQTITPNEARRYLGYGDKV